MFHVILIDLIFFSGVGGFLPGMKQIGNVASLPGIVKVRFRHQKSNVFFL